MIKYIPNILSEHLERRRISTAIHNVIPFFMGHLFSLKQLRNYNDKK